MKFMDRKIRILGIAPYESLKTNMEKIAEHRDNIELTCFVGNLDEGDLIAQKYTDTDFDVIISRGGTAELIQQHTTLPVINIPLSVYDTLRAIKLSEHYTNKHAIVGFPSITQNAHFLCEMFQYDIDIYTLHDHSDVHKTLAILKSKGYQMILCDMITDSLAKQYDLSSILITSGVESIELAYDQAIEAYHIHQNLTQKVDLLSGILNKLPSSVYVYNDSHNLIYRNIPSAGNLGTLTDLSDKLANYIDTILLEGNKNFTIELDQHLLDITGTSYKQYHQNYILFFIQAKKNVISLTDNGIHYLTKENADRSYDYFYSITSSNTSLRTIWDTYKKASDPIVIISEEGIDQLQFALMYLQGEFQNSSFLDIDCAELNEQGWTFLKDKLHSPLNTQNKTIFFRNIDTLSTESFTSLKNIIKFWKLCEYNQLLFAFNCTQNSEVSEYCNQIADGFTCLTLNIPSLREQIRDIPNLSSLYISHLNMQLGKEISGFEPGALDILTSYQWPGNYNQFRRVLTELASITTSLYIKTEDVKKILQKEHRQEVKNPHFASSFDLSRTLEEINLDILQQVLYEEGGNQSSTAKRLGISRSTLWRMLQKLDTPVYK